jgi:cobalt transporter subunit CbtA
MVRETVFTAAIAGLVAALVLTILQIVWVTPLIVQAESYERPAASDAHEHTDEHHVSSVGAAAHEHQHDAEEWKPQDGWQRTAFTLAANLLLGFGYAMALIAVYLLWREPRNVAYGAIYGIGGFLVFFLAPSLGLPPELPGTAAAAVIVRQSWWVMVAVATAAGLLILFSRVTWKARILGLVLIVAPHFIAAPQPEVAGSVAPEALQSQFRVAATLSNAIFWLLLGLVSSLAFRRMAQGRTAA